MQEMHRKINSIMKPFEERIEKLEAEVEVLKRRLGDD